MGDPNLHTHVVLANKVQGADGAWRSVDSRALHHAVVSVSEVYDNLFADELARRLPVEWGWRDHGPKRTPGFELEGVGEDLLAQFSTRAAQVDAGMIEAIADFFAARDVAAPAIAQLTDLLSQRVQALTELALATRPAWLRPLDDEPAPGTAHDDWTSHLAATLTHADLNKLIPPGFAVRGSTLHRTPEPTTRTRTDRSIHR